MPSATMASRSSTGRWSASSLCARVIPTSVSPANRTRMPSRGKDVLMARRLYPSPSWNDQLQRGSRTDREVVDVLVQVPVDRVVKRLVRLDPDLARHRTDGL